MNPLKKFKEWCERRHWSVRGIGIVLLLLLFLVLFGMISPRLFATGYFAAVEEEQDPTSILLDVSYIIVGFVVLFIFWDIHQRINEQSPYWRIVGILTLLMILPVVWWVMMLLFYICVYWQSFLVLLVSVGIVFIIWKLRGKRIWELKKRKEAVAWELEDQLKELKEQLARGVITQEEYEQKKKKLPEKI